MTKVATWSILLILFETTLAVDAESNTPDNFLLLGSLVGCMCRNFLSSQYPIDERMFFGQRHCSCSNKTYNIWYRTCSLDDYLALQKCRKSLNPNVCIRIKTFAEDEDPCQSLTDVLKKEYCINGDYQYFKFFYGRTMYQSMCHFLSHSPSPIDFNKEINFSLQATADPRISSVYNTIAIYKVTITDPTHWVDDLRDILQSNSSRQRVRRLISGETTLFDSRTRICLSCSEVYNFVITVSYHKDMITLQSLPIVACNGTGQYATIDFQSLVQDVKIFTHMRVKIDFFPINQQFASFAFRLILSDFTVSLEYKDECRKSSTSLLICSVNVPQEASHFVGIDSITWSFNGRTFADDSDLIVSREKSDEKSSLYVNARGNYTCAIAVQVFLTFPSKMEVVRREGSMKIKKICKSNSNRSSTHIMINLLIIIVALILIGACLMIIRFKGNRLRRFDKSTSVTISPATLDKKSYPASKMMGKSRG